MDLSDFMNRDDLKAVLKAKYGDQKGTELFDGVTNIETYLNQNYPSIDIRANDYVNTTVNLPPTLDNLGIKISFSAGDPFFGSYDVDPLLGVYNGRDAFVKVDIDLKNGSAVEANITTTSGPTFFTKTTLSTDLTQIGSENGSYITLYSPALSSTSYNFSGVNAEGCYFGVRYDTVNTTDLLHTNSEALVYIPQEVIEGRRQAVTSSEVYGKLLYDIYNNTKMSLTPAEMNIIETGTAVIAQQALQNITSLTPTDKMSIINGQIADILYKVMAPHIIYYIE
jgi:hypothetical protein